MPVALIEMGLSYRDFMRLTPRQWNTMYEVFLKKKKRDFKDIRALFCEQTAWLINISGKTVEEPITPEQIMNPPEKKDKEKKTEEPVDWDKLERQIGK